MERKIWMNMVGHKIQFNLGFASSYISGQCREVIGSMHIYDATARYPVADLKLEKKQKTLLKKSDNKGKVCNFHSEIKTSKPRVG